MEFSRIEELLRDIRSITGFTEAVEKAASIIIFCSTNNNWDPDNIVRVSGYSEDEVGLFLCNLVDKGHFDLQNSRLIFKESTDEGMMAQVMVMALDAAGIKQWDSYDSAASNMKIITVLNDLGLPDLSVN